MRTIFSTLIFLSFSVSAFLPPPPGSSAGFAAKPLAERAQTLRQDSPNQPTSLKDCQRGGWRNYPHAGFRNQGDCTRFATTGRFVCRDSLGCLSYARGGPIRIATILAVSGDLQDVGLDSQRAVELALTSQGELFGHSLALRPEDDGCSPEGGEAAASAVSTDATIAAVVGTSCSSAALVAAPILSNAGFSLISPSSTSPVLTDPASHEAGFLRTAHNDAGNAAAMAQFLFEQGALTSAVIAGESPIQSAIGRFFIDGFDSLGGSNLAEVATSNDGSAVAAAMDEAVANGVPDVLYFPVFDPLGPAIMSEARSRPELAEMMLATNDYWYSEEAIEGLGPNADGLLVGLPDDSFTGGEAYGAFSADYLATYGVEPRSFFAPHAYDAAQIILAGVRNTAIIDKRGTLHVGRQALRSALFATAGLDGLRGSITCDPLGECGATGFIQMEVHVGPPAMGLRVNYGHDWVESFYPAGHTVTITVTESDGVTVKATAELVTAPREDWGGEPGFQTQPSDWTPAQPDLQPEDWVYANVSNGVSAQVQLGTITGVIDLEADSIQGTILAPWFSGEAELAVECHPWGSPEPVDMKFDTVLPDGADTYSCGWNPETEWDVQAGQDIGIGYFGPDGHWVANAFFVSTSQGLIVASIEGDWFWTSGFGSGALLTLSLLDSPGGNLLWTGSMTADDGGFVFVGHEVHQVDMLPGHYVVVTDRVGEKTLILESITMDVFAPEQERVAGTAPPGRTVRVVVATSPAGEDQVALDVTADPETGEWSADFGAIGVDVTEEMRPWSFAQIFDEDGDANEAGPPPAPPEELWVAAFTYTPPAETWAEGLHTYRHELSFTVPAPFEYIGPEVSFTASSDAPSYDGYALLRPTALRARVEGGGDGGCPVIEPMIQPTQATRFLIGYSTNAPMTYEEAVALFDSAIARVFWDGGGSAELERQEILQYQGDDWWLEFVCTFASP